MDFLKNNAGLIWSRLAAEDGIQHVEEALLLALIAVAAIVATTALGTDVSAVFTQVATTMCAGAVTAC